MCVHLHTHHTCTSVYICACVYMYMSFVCTVSHNTVSVCTLCIHDMCVYIHTRIYVHACTHTCPCMFMCSCGLAMHKLRCLSFLLLRNQRVCHFALLLHKLDKLKPSGFIRKKWIFPSHTVSVISSSLVNNLC